MKLRKLALSPAAALLVLAGCGDGAPDQSALPPGYRVAERYAAALEVRLDDMTRRPTGLYVQDLEVGEGMRADSGDIARVHYTGWLSGGLEFDSSRDRAPLEVPLGYGRVIAGWDHGVVGMRVGGRRRLVIPPALGYGDAGRGRIPGNATLVFDVQLVDVVDRTSGSDASP
ncbi:MAG: FKBP-type peptidyl-prolyl cis-trans isomerase [Gemmatimonadetes bacterium]|nr:FKBP-type peptidyl-prolyl cis-trans isomerase [Gemmatimonadota bacterium]